VHRFLARLWRVAADAGPGDATPSGDPSDLVRKAHWAIDKVSSDLGGRFAFNTAIAAVMELVNDVYRFKDDAPPEHVRFAIATAGSLIFPFAPHLGAEVYELIAGGRVWEEPWPVADPALLASDTIELVVQVNGKLRDRVAAPAGAGEEEQVRIAQESPRVAAHLDGRALVKTIWVPDKLVNFVVR
jgi:leucyl-tRNA synthetase